MHSKPFSRRFLAMAVAALCAGGACVAPVHAAGSAADPSGVDRLMVKFVDAQSRAQALANSARLPRAGEVLPALSEATGQGLRYQRAMSGEADVVRLERKMTLEEAQALAERLAAQPGVEWAVPDQRRHALRVPNDPRYAEQWHYQTLVTGQALGANNYGIDLPAAWDRLTGAENPVVVAVIDTGILYEHPDLKSVSLPGYDFVSEPFIGNDNDPAGAADSRDPNPADPGDWVEEGDPCYSADRGPVDSSWHGSHVAGTIGAATDNAIGGAGINWGARILPVRVLGKCGGYDSDIVDAVRWSVGGTVPGVPANPHPARVLNLSLGGDGPCSAPYQSAFNEVLARNAVPVVAAGNENENMNLVGKTPANCPGVITVAATNQQGQRSYYSNYGSRVDIAAPGGDRFVDSRILSTVDGGTKTPLNDGSYAAYQGTSMATPHVAGVVSLILSRNGSLTPTQVRDILRASSTPFPTYPTGENCTTATCGAGVLNAAAALAATPPADNMPDPFTFAQRKDVPPGAFIQSETVTVSGLSEAVAIEVSNGSWSRDCTGTFSTEPGTIGNGERFCLGQQASSQPGQSTITQVRVGAYVTEFISTTISDSTPDPFSFGSRTGVQLNTMMTSDPVVISGINVPAAVEVRGGEYSIGCTGQFTAAAGSIENGQRVCVRHVSSGGNNQSVTTTLTVGGVSGSFTTTTAPADSGGGGATHPLWLMLAALPLALRRRRA
ncbi:MAG: S8 family serine peptidase [Pseudomonadota bacterium]